MMLSFVVICVVLAISAAYKLIEWAAALALGQGADDSRAHDRQIQALQSREAQPL